MTPKGPTLRRSLKNLSVCTFTTATKLEDMWRTIARGQSLECIRCYQGRVRKITSGVIYCETCEAYRPETAFSLEAKSILVKGSDGLVQCEACEHGKQRVTRAETRFEHCYGQKLHSRRSNCKNGVPIDKNT